MILFPMRSLAFGHVPVFVIHTIPALCLRVKDLIFWVFLVGELTWPSTGEEAEEASWASVHLQTQWDGECFPFSCCHRGKSWGPGGTPDPNNQCHFGDTEG